jgi:hypothetical protein
MPGPQMLCVYQFKVVLRGVSPMIWRRLLLRSDHTIADLHYARERQKVGGGAIRVVWRDG